MYLLLPIRTDVHLSLYGNEQGLCRLRASSLKHHLHHRYDACGRCHALQACCWGPTCPAACQCIHTCAMSRIIHAVTLKCCLCRTRKLWMCKRMPGTILQKQEDAPTPCVPGAGWAQEADIQAISKGTCSGNCLSWTCSCLSCMPYIVNCCFHSTLCSTSTPCNSNL